MKKLEVDIVEDFIAKDRIPDAFKYLLSHVNGSSEYNSLKEQLLIRKSLYTRIESDNRKGTIDNDTYFRQRSMISHVLLSVTHEIHSIEIIEEEVTDTVSDINENNNELSELKERVNQIEIILREIAKKIDVNLFEKVINEERKTTSDKKISEEIKRTKQNVKLGDPEVNYVFVYGRAGVGKTTILASIFKYLYENYRLKYNSIGNKEGVKYLNSLLESLQQQDFPKTTGIGNIEEVDLSIDDPKTGLSTVITFLDMSGEDLRYLQPLENEKRSNVAVNFDTYFKENESISFLLVTTPMATKDDDIIFTHFINHLTEKYKNTKLNVSLIINKWDLMRDDKKDDLTEFIKENLPQTYYSLSKKNIDATAFSFSALEGEAQSMSQIVKYLLKEFRTTTPNNVQTSIASIRRLLRLH